MDIRRERSTMNVALWIVQGLLADLFLFAQRWFSKAGSRTIHGQMATRRSPSRDHTDRQGPAGNTRSLA
jgi:hypothetical protein